jgi:ethanolaminephosphotransferase
MSDTTFSGWNTMLSVYTAATVLCIIPYQMVGLPALAFTVEKWILISLFTAFSAFHVHYGYGIVTEMCEHFGIKCFTVSWMLEAVIIRC